MAEMMRKPRKEKTEDNEDTVQKRESSKPISEEEEGSHSPGIPEETLKEKLQQESSDIDLKKLVVYESIEQEEKQIDNKDLERKEIEKKEIERKEIEKKEIERKEIERKEIEKKEIEITRFSPFPVESMGEEESPRQREDLTEKKEVISKNKDLQSSESDTFEQLTEEIPMTEVVQDKYEGLSELEKSILEIAEDILKLKRHDANLETERIEKMSPMVEELYHKCIAKLKHTKGYAKEKIFDTIQRLEEGYWLVTDQRRTKKEIVESEIHQNILEFIEKYPGIHARDPAIEEELGITRNPFLKHIMTLEAFQLIRTVKVGRTQNYFLANVPDIFDDLCVLFKNPLIPDIIRNFIKDPGASISGIAEELDVYHGAIQYHIKKLIEMNILRKEKVDKQNYYHVNIELLKRYNKIFDEPPF